MVPVKDSGILEKCFFPFFINTVSYGNQDYDFQSLSSNQQKAYFLWFHIFIHWP